MQGIDRIFAGNVALCVLLIAVGAACGKAPEPETASGLLPAAPAPAQGCGEDGFVETTLYGALEGEINWTASALNCEGMRRPDDAGARLRFAGASGDIRLAIIIAIPSLQPGQLMREMPSNVTLIEEGDGRFFSTSGNENCWTDVDAQSPLPDRPDTHSVSGTLYCITPLVEVNGDTSVSLRELRFAGLVDWDQP